MTCVTKVLDKVSCAMAWSEWLEHWGMFGLIVALVFIFGFAVISLVQELFNWYVRSTSGDDDGGGGESEPGMKLSKLQRVWISGLWTVVILLYFYFS